MSSKKNLLSIGEIAERTGSTVSAIRFYADEQLVPVVRSSSGHRYFQRSSIRRISFILILQEIGYSLRQIKSMLSSLPKQRTPTKGDWEQLSRKIDADLERKVNQLNKLRTSLTGCIGCGCLSLENCRLYNADDRAHSLGPGPRYLLGDSPKSI